MIEQEYILLIMNCKKYMNKALHQKNTWLQHIPSFLKFYHVIGDDGLEEEFKFDNTNQILWLKVPDDYNSLPKKVISAYNAVFKTFKFKYIFKTDDDQMLTNYNFFNILTGILNTNSNIHYGGYIVDVKQSHVSQYYKIHSELPKNLIVMITKYCSGRFYFLSHNSVKDLLSKMNIIKNEYLEDYAIGYYLDESLKSNMLNLFTNKFFIDMS